LDFKVKRRLGVYCLIGGIGEEGLDGGLDGNCVCIRLEIERELLYENVDYFERDTSFFFSHRVVHEVYHYYVQVSYHVHWKKIQHLRIGSLTKEIRKKRI
jgi:hypothetical protein